MLFVRTYHGMLGGHLKVFEYMHHVRASGLFEPVLYLTLDSTQSPRQWLPGGAEIIDAPVEADAYFVAGFNWRILEAAGIDLRAKPVVNLLQGLRHTAAGDPRREFLSRPALRICVSLPVYKAVRDAGLANGPLVLVRNGIDVERLHAIHAGPKRRCVFIAGAKNAAAARTLGDTLTRSGIECEVCDVLLERDAFLARMGACDIVVALPDPNEGFFLPPLEAMAMGCAVVLPNCLGASSYAIDRVTCLSPPFELQAVADAAAELRANDALRLRIREEAGAIASRHSLERERSEFIAALQNYVTAHEAC